MNHSHSECAATVAHLSEFCSVVRKAEAQEEQEEQAYVQLLEFLQTHSACRPHLEAELESMVREFRYARAREPRLSIDALAFCMHSLRWAGVLQAMQREHREFFAPRQDDFPWRLIDAYSPAWEGRSKYEYYDDHTERGGGDA